MPLKCLLLLLCYSATPENTHFFIRGSIIVWLTSYLTGLDSTKEADVLLIQHKQSSSTQTRKTEVSSPVKRPLPISINIYRRRSMESIWTIWKMTTQKCFKFTLVEVAPATAALLAAQMFKFQMLLSMMTPSLEMDRPCRWVLTLWKVPLEAQYLTIEISG